MTTKKFQAPTDEEIARYAYCLWEAEGRIHGRDLDYWLQAKAHLIAAREYEAGSLSEASSQEPVARTSQTVTISAPAPAAKPARRRQSRVIREAEPVCV